ncbi:p-hydroxybenzoic acid efflux subunit AaeA [Holospora obtusa F1]|uniref:p-hydroxybenzoic acid efflux subunit AaeA n=1 Tax=Holospora obtusa F1 TaxID=1399147 RepID=W6TDY7_HOLOB|nr:efflux RND transporter periplasmic adaptor subunit [Holospora obtusa]ETZ06819.1 p-hydroxybenzoic acid efflux subunit AaeA [Holospora obtusa F1]
MRRSKVNLKYIAIIAALGFSGALYLAIHSMKAPVSYTGEMNPQPYFHGISGIGVVEPKEKVLHLAFQQKGVIESIYVVPGQRVKKGQILCALNQEEIDARIGALQAVYENALIQEKKIKEKSLIAEKLYKKKVFSDHETRLNVYNARQASAKRKECENLLYQAKLEKDRHLIKAPTDGTILSSNLHQGQYSLPGKEVVIMGDLTKLTVCVEFDEMYAECLPLTVTALGKTRSITPQKVSLRLHRIDPYIYPKRNLPGIHSGIDSRVLHVYYDIISNSKPLFTGQELDVFVEKDTNSKQK